MEKHSLKSFIYLIYFVWIFKSGLRFSLRFFFSFSLILHNIIILYLLWLCVCVQKKIYHVWLIINFWSLWLIPLVLIVWWSIGALYFNTGDKWFFLAINHIENSNEFYLIMRTRAPSHKNKISMLNNRNSLEIFGVVLRFTPLLYDIFHFNVHRKRGGEMSTLISKNCPI